MNRNDGRKETGESQNWGHCLACSGPIAGGRGEGGPYCPECTDPEGGRP